MSYSTKCDDGRVYFEVHHDSKLKNRIEDGCIHAQELGFVLFFTVQQSKLLTRLYICCLDLTSKVFWLLAFTECEARCFNFELQEYNVGA